MRFSYSAQDKSGNMARGDIEADDRKTAIDAIVAKGLVPLTLELAEKRISGRPISIFISTLFSGGLTTFDQIIITRHLGTILQSGTDLLAALDIGAEDAIRPLVRRILLDVKSRVATGETFSQSLAAWEKQFNPVLLNLVKAAETSGNLPGTLINYSQELRKEYAFSKKVRGAMFYPAILMTALFAMMLLMLVIVVPRIKTLFATTDFEPPFYTKALFAASDILTGNTVGVFIGIAVFALLIVIGLRNTRMRRALSGVLWYLPYLNKIHKNAMLFRFSKTLSTLIKAGFPLKSALLVTGEAVGSKYRPALAKFASESLERGISLADSMRKDRELFPLILTSLVATGEKTGQLDSVLSQMAEFYEEEVVYALEQFLTIIEPVLIVIVGIIVGLMVGSLISPIYRLIGRF